MTERGRRWLSTLAVVLMLVPTSFLSMTTMPATIANAAGSPAVTYSLQGCRNNQTSPPYKSGTLICNDGLYTPGDLGKGWAELDLVPFRLTIQTGKTGGQVSRNLDVDYLFKNGVYGYDVLSVPVLNTAPDDGTGTGQPRPVTTSAAACAFTVTPNTQPAPTGSSPNGSAVNSLYRTLTVTNMPANATCVYDFYARVALGAHNVAPGRCDAKLHADLADSNNQIQGSGAKEVPIQICNINFQTLSKSMTASQNQDYVWDVVTTPTYARITFGNTCGTSQTTSQSNPVTVTWTKSPAAPSVITINTHVTVSNPASRSLTVDVVDNVYAGTALLQTLDSGPIVVKANSVPTVINDTFTVPANTPTSNLNDLATATYSDTVTGQPISQTTTATATAPLQVTTTNGTAVITNTESLLGGTASPFRFSVDSVSGASGAFGGGYTLGTKTAGPVTWTSASQSSSGSVTFGKTVYLAAATPVIASDTLQDSSSLTASSGFTDSDVRNYALDSDAQASLTITKSLSFTPSASDGAQSFVFDVTDSSGNAVLVPDSHGNLVSPTVTINPGQNSGSTVVPGLMNGMTYTVAEQQVANYDPAPAAQQVTINIVAGNPSTCGNYTAAFSNTIHANVSVQKITNPAGNEAGWTFQLFDPSNTQISTVTTTGAGAINFPVNLTQEGTYTVKEVAQSGWLQTASTNSTFSVNFPANGAQTIATTFTNTQEYASATVQKITNPAGNEAGWSFTLYDPSSKAVGTATTTGTGPAQFVDTSNNPVKLTAAGTYTVKETAQNGWLQTNATGQTFTINWGAGGTTNGQVYNAVFTNTQEYATATVQKISVPAGNEAGWTFGLYDPSSNLIGTAKTTGTGAAQFVDASNNPVKLTQAGTYTVKEISTENGWVNTSSTGSTFTINWGPGGTTNGQVYNAVFTNTQETASATVQKVTVPAGNEAGWSFTLYDPTNTAIGTATTTGTGPAQFLDSKGNPVSLTQEGTYTVKETSSQTGWVNTSSTGSTFTISWAPGGTTNGQVYNAVFTNSQEYASATVTKITQPAGNEAGWSFTLYDPSNTAIGTAKTTGTGPAQFVDASNNPVKLTKQGTYTIKETAQAGWLNTASTGSTFTINWGAGGTANGQVFAATFTNTQESASATVQKITVPAGNEAGWTFGLYDAANNLLGKATTTGTGAVGFVDASNNPVKLTQQGTYTIQEISSETGWVNTSSTGSSFTIDWSKTANGQVFAATFTNTQESASATVQKITVPAGNEAGWTFTLYDPIGNAIGTATTTGTGAAQFVDSKGNPVKLIQEGTYTVKETSSQAGWINTSSTGSTFTVAFPGSNGQTYNAVFTNSQEYASATVQKITVPAGNEAGWSFTLYDPSNTAIGTATTTGTGAAQFVDASNNPVKLSAPGTYTIKETGQKGWVNTSSTGSTFSINWGPGGTTNGQVFAATFTNTQESASATVQKITNPAGNEAGWTFGLYDSANNLLGTAKTTGTGATGFVDSLGNPVSLTKEGTYTIKETSSQTGWINTSSTNSTFTINWGPGGTTNGQVFAATFTNTQESASATVQKISVPAGNEAGWTFGLYDSSNTLLGQATTTGTGATGFVDSLGNPVSLTQQGTYAIKEISTETGWINTASTNSTFTINWGPGGTTNGQVFAATFTNSQESASATVQKITNPAGNESGWTFTLYDPSNTAIGTATTSSAAAVGFVDSKGNPVSLTQQGTYTIKETSTKTGWVNTGSTGSTFSINWGTGGTANGQVFAATFTNTQESASATVQKITNPAGYESGWTFTLYDPSNTAIGTAKTTGTGAAQFLDASNNPVKLTAPGTYTIKETAQAGWLNTASTNSTFTINWGAGGTANGQVFAATFTNTQETASATVQKVTYPAGNEAGWGFTLYDPSNTKVGTATTTGTGAAQFVDASNNPVKLTTQGTYTVKETSSKSGWVNTAATSTFMIDWTKTTNGQVFATTFTNTQCVSPKITATSGTNGAATFTITDANTPSTGTGLMGGSLPALSNLALGTQYSNGGISVVKLTNSSMPASSWADGVGTLTLTANKINASQSSSIGLIATALGGTPAKVTVSSTGAVTTTSAGTCSTVFDPLVTSTIRQAGAPQTDTYTGIDKSESQLTIYNGKPGVGTMKIQVNTTTFTVAGMKDGDQKVLDIGSALVAGGNNTISVTSTGQPGGNAVLLVAPPGAAH